MVDLNSTENKESSEDNTSQVSLEQQNKELIDQIKRLQADFINFRTRTEQEKAILVDYGKELAIKEFLELFENFEKAKEILDKKGIELIHKQFQEVLCKLKISQISNQGKYNPEFHEVLCKECHETEEDTIIDVYQKGYISNGKVLRPSKVKVSGGKNE